MCRYARGMLPRRRAARSFLLAFALVAVVHLVAQLTGGESVADGDPGAAHAAARRRALVRDGGTAWPAGHPGPGRPSASRGSATARPELASGDAAFLVMVGFFLLAQLAYIAAFWPFRGRSVLHVHRPRLLGYLAVVVALVARVRRRRRRAARAGARLRRLPGHHGRARDRRQPAHRGRRRACSSSPTASSRSTRSCRGSACPPRGSGSWRPTSSRRRSSSPVCCASAPARTHPHADGCRPRAVSGRHPARFWVEIDQSVSCPGFDHWSMRRGGALRGRGRGR